MIYSDEFSVDMCNMCFACDVAIFETLYTGFELKHATYNRLIDYEEINKRQKLIVNKQILKYSQNLVVRLRHFIVIFKI